ncbi:WRKY transcription factor 2 [Pycnococcus provasolii]
MGVSTPSPTAARTPGPRDRAMTRKGKENGGKDSQPISPLPQVSPVDHATLANATPPWSPAAAAVIGAAFAAAAVSAAALQQNGGAAQNDLRTPVATRGGAGSAAPPPPPPPRGASSVPPPPPPPHSHSLNNKPPALSIPATATGAETVNGGSPHRVVRPQPVLAQSPLGANGATNATANNQTPFHQQNQRPSVGSLEGLLQNAAAAAAAAVSAMGSPGGLNTVMQESPVLLPSSQMEPSPTTGTFPFGALFSSMKLPISGSLQGDVSSLEKSAMSQWTPTPLSATLQDFSNTKGAGAGGRAMKHNDLIAAAAGAAAAALSGDANMHTPMDDRSRPAHLSFAHAAAGAAIAALRFSPLGMPSPTSPGGAEALALGERPVEDGYHWRKYGQKHVKGSMFPRSYYKCTHPNCPVKKKVERSEIGLVTSCVYKGKHTHERPMGTPGKVVDMTLCEDVDGVANGQATRKVLTFGEASPSADGSGGRNTMSSGPSQFLSGSEEGLDGLPSTATPMHISNDAAIAAAAVAAGGALLASAVRQRSGEIIGVPRPSSDMANDGAVAHHLTPLHLNLTPAPKSVEPDAKRRRVDGGGSAVPPPPAPPRRLSDVTLEHARSSDASAGKDSKLVVRTRSTVEILEDGYRWRKYGQKLVKGNPNPRSYYKCTFSGCSVRKHVERNSSDPSVVVTTYEGVHSHPAPSQTPAQRGEGARKPRLSPPTTDNGKGSKSGSRQAAARGIRPLVMPDLDNAARRAGEEPALPTPDGEAPPVRKWSESVGPPPPPPPPLPRASKGAAAGTPRAPPPPKKAAAAAANAAFKLASAQKGKAPTKGKPAGLKIDPIHAAAPASASGATVTPTSAKEPTPTSARSLDVGGFLTTPTTPSPTELPAAPELAKIAVAGCDA